MGQEVVFTCQQNGSLLVWTINLPNITFNNPAISSLAGTVTSFIDDPGFGFEIHVLNSSSSSTVISELRVTAVRQLNGVTVECLANSGRFTSTIQLILSVPG